jgi:hypothetical protein
VDTAILTQIDALLQGSRCWGAELDLKYRVLAITFEPEATRHPDGDIEDARLQLVLHPVNTIQGRLVHDGTTLERFDVEQLPLVVDRLDGARIDRPVVTSSTPKLMGELSFEGRADVPDGYRHIAALSLQSNDRLLSMRCTFDEAELRRPDGSALALS